MKALTSDQISLLSGSSPTLHSFRQFSGVAVDSRLVQPNEIFFALEGAKVDGHAFLGQAAVRGATAAVVSKAYAGPDHGLILVKVDDPLAALQHLAKSTLSAYKARIVAVTGSVGKTTTKDFITTLLRTKYRLASSPGNHNSQIGLPLTILNHTQGDEEVIVLEMGMTGAGHIANLVQVAPPDIAVVTAVALNHVSNFSSFEQIALAKAEIFSNPKTSLGILPRELTDYDTMAAIGSCSKQSFSLMAGVEADFILREEGESLRVYHNGKRAATLSRPYFPGKHNLHNFLAAITAARNLHVSWEEIQSGIPLLTLPEKRLQHVEIGGVLFVNDSYNAVDISVKAAIDSLPAPKAGGKTIAVLGEMLELGPFSEKCHREVGEHALKSIDSMICLGKECRPIHTCWMDAGRPVKWLMDFDDVVAELRRQLQPGDVVLLKGSRSNGLCRILEEL